MFERRGWDQLTLRERIRVKWDNGGLDRLTLFTPLGPLVGLLIGHLLR